MATHDYDIANQSGSNFRADLNNCLDAIVSNNSSSSEPSTKFAYMLWVDTTNNLIKLRNSANNAWITLPLSTTADNTVDVNGGAIDGTAIGANAASTGAFTTLSASSALTANAGVVIDELTIDADTITATDDFIIDAAGDITLDATDNQIFFKDAGTTVGTLSMTGSDLKLISNVNDKDMIFAGTDSGTEVVALTLDMSDAGTAIFNNKVGIGTSSPANTLHISKSTTSADGTVYPSLKVENLSAGSGNSYANIVLNGGNGTTQFSILNDGRSSNSVVSLRTDTSSPIAFMTDGSERMRIDSSGKVLLGSTSSTFNNDSKIVLAPNSDSNFTNNGQTLSLNRTGSHGEILGFYYDGSGVGSISTNANSLPSDRNFKRNISNLELGLNLINKLIPSQYNYKIDDKDSPKMYGLIAQDLEESLAEVGIEKNSTWLLQHNETKDEKQSDYALDYLKLTPILIKAIQEQQELIEDLQTQINNLRGK